MYKEILIKYQISSNSNENIFSKGNFLFNNVT